MASCLNGFYQGKEGIIDFSKAYFFPLESFTYRAAKFFGAFLNKTNNFAIMMSELFFLS